MSRIDKALEEAVRLREPRSPIRVEDAPLPDKCGFVPANPYIVTLTDPSSAITEEYRKLKSMIIKLTKKSVFRNTIMVTSTDSGEGKSITSINLAVILAQEYNHSVLLVDADLRRPSLNRYLGIKPDKGLADCLVRGIDASAAIVKTGFPKLSFLSSGTAVKNPVELLSSLQMKRLLNELKQRYRDRYIIIDTPPVLPFAETHAVSAMVDGVVFVVKEGSTSAKGLREALEMLRDTTVLGVVLNAASVENLNGRYRYYQTYYRYLDEARKQAG